MSLVFTKLICISLFVMQTKLFAYHIAAEVMVNVMETVAVMVADALSAPVHVSVIVSPFTRYVAVIVTCLPESVFVMSVTSALGTT